MFIKRVELASQTPRFIMWQKILAIMDDEWNPFIGAGLRGAEEALEKEYSHNSYFDVLFETGLIGFFIWIFLVSYTTLCAMKRMKYDEFLPWIHTWFVLLVMFASLSLVYNPFPWLLIGLLTTNLPQNSR